MFSVDGFPLGRQEHCYYMYEIDNNQPYDGEYIQIVEDIGGFMTQTLCKWHRDVYRVDYYPEVGVKTKYPDKWYLVPVNIR